MASFIIHPDGFNQIKKKWLVRTWLITAGTAAIGIGVAVSNDNTGSSFTFWPYYILFLFGFTAFRTNRNLKKMKAIFSSYRLTISDEGIITREQLSLDPLSVSALEISEISKYKGGSFCIKGLTKADVIYVPRQIDNAALLESELNKLHTVSVLTNTPLKQQLAIVLAITTIVSILGVFIPSNKFIVAVCGTILTAILIYVFVEMRRSKNIPEQAKRRSWIYLIVLVVVLINILTKVFDINLADLL